MLNEKSRKFLNDEMGGGTISGLLWLVLFVGIIGLAVDFTSGMRNRTIIQATAHVAALADTVDLPSPTVTVGAALTSSVGNMPDDLFNHALEAGDIKIGASDTSSRNFVEGWLAPDLTELNRPIIPKFERVSLH